MADDMEQDPKSKKPKRSKKKQEQVVAEPETNEADVEPEAETPPEPPKKAKKPKDEDDEARSAHRVEHAARVITLTGKDVKLRVMTPAQQEKWDIKSITGKMGAPCAEPLVILFKSGKAAEKFFDHCLHYEGTDERQEFIDSGEKTEWYSDKLMGLMGFK